MMLAGASAAELCTAVMTGGFGVLRDAIAELERYLGARGASAASIVGVTADRIGTFAAQPLRPDHWRGFVPPETLA
jgi:hypothetical protein